MSIQVIGAGLGRTGTTSLKIALETLIQGSCYHMSEVLAHPEHIARWRAAAHGRMPNWQTLFDGYKATVDWPAASFWPELLRAFPDAVVILSERDVDAWWRSASSTIFPILESNELPAEWKAMFGDVLAARWTLNVRNREAAISAYLDHNRHVREAVPPHRLVVWRAEEGWAPLCKALNKSIPPIPFPRTNTQEDWEKRAASHDRATAA